LTIVYEMAIRASANDGDAVRRWFHAGPAKIWCELALLRTFDAYVPSQGDAQDPYNDDGTGPGLLCTLGFSDEGSLRASVDGEMFRRGLSGLPASASVTADAMERKFYSVDGEIADQVLQSPFSYVVRYHRPAEDERAFVEHYVADHPALLARLPKVRSVLCDFPLAWTDPNGFGSSDYMLGNEVVFDSIEDFNAAMASPIRHEMRAHYRKFPPFSGRNTHYPMTRTRLF